MHALGDEGGCYKRRRGKHLGSRVIPRVEPYSEQSSPRVAISTDDNREDGEWQSIMKPQVDDATNATARWMAAFDDPLRRCNASVAAELFLPDGHQRDIIAFTRHVETMNGATHIRMALSETVARTQPKNLRPNPNRTQARKVTKRTRDPAPADPGPAAARRCPGSSPMWIASSSTTG
jgi:hypothetical protein